MQIEAATFSLDNKLRFNQTKDIQKNKFAW